MDRYHLDDFETLQTVGAGTVGTIYRVRHKITRQDLALKILGASFQKDPRVVRRFEREMMILAKLHHPHIIRYFGSGRHDGQLFYLMELLEGGTVKELLTRGGLFTWRETAECGRQIASALQHAHNHGIIHRDLKPGNIFLTEDATVKLGDFGIARDLRAKDLTDTGLTVGTYAYMAPELVRGTRQITGAVDLYALGCVLFEMITGRPPFLGDNFAQVFEQHLHTPPPSPADLAPGCPMELDQLIAKLLAKDPEARPFNARAVQGMLSELVDRAANGQGDPRAHVRDRAAVDVHLFRLSLAERIRASRSARSVSWMRLGCVALAMVLLIILAAVFL